MVPYPTKRCKCKELATHGESPHNRTTCEEHAVDASFAFVERACVSCGLSHYVLDHNNHCKDCDPTQFNLVRLRKQRVVRDFLEANGQGDWVSYDRKIPEGCGLERPDFLYDFGKLFVVLEVDEWQHRDRACSCEQTRMVNISQSLGMQTLFIRYNPDSFTINGQVSRVPTKRRLDELLRMLKQYRDGQLSSFCMVRYMYYDSDRAISDEMVVG